MAKYCQTCRARYADDSLSRCPRDQSPLEADPLVGWSIAGRRLDALIGEGAQAYIYRATHLELGRTEVIKVLKRTTGTISPKRFAREARAMSLMSSAHIVQIYDYGHTAEGEHFLVMEHVDGQPLSEVLTRYGRLSPPRALVLAEHVCLGLAEAHRNDIIHRDVKPENVLIERRGATDDRARLVDFGVAHDQTANLTLPGRIFGTPGYLAPEQLKSQPLDARSDLFSVGVLLYEMLSGTNPFQVDGESPIEQLSSLWRRLSAPVAPLSTMVAGVPPALDALVAALMSCEPNDRPGDAASVALQLIEIRLSMTGGIRASNPGLRAVQDELGEQARLLDARREALLGRKRALDTLEQRVATARRALALSEEAARQQTQPGYIQHSTPPHGVLHVASMLPPRHTPLQGFMHQQQGLMPPQQGFMPQQLAEHSHITYEHTAPMQQLVRANNAGRGWVIFAATLFTAVALGTLVVATALSGQHQQKQITQQPAPPVHRSGSPALPASTRTEIVRRP